MEVLAACGVEATHRGLILQRDGRLHLQYCGVRKDTCRVCKDTMIRIPSTSCFFSRSWTFLAILCGFLWRLPDHGSWS